MQETIAIGSNQIVTVKEESIGGILLDFKALKTDDTVCLIADLNKISIELAVFRDEVSQPEYIVNDYLDYVLRALFAGTFRYTVATMPRKEGYLIPIPFDGKLELKGKDRLEIRVKVQNTAFTALDVAKSSLTIETIPTKVANQVLTVVEAQTYVTGDDNVNKLLGDSITKIVLVNDLTKGYDASNKSKPTNGVVLTGEDFEKISSENLLLAENLDLLQNNPETPVSSLVLYNSVIPLFGVRLKTKYDKAVDANARIMLLRKRYI